MARSRVVRTRKALSSRPVNKTRQLARKANAPASKSKGTTPSTTSQQKRRRFKPGTVALREIRRYQKGHELLLPHLSFRRVVVQILKEEMKSYRIQGAAIEALQEATEGFLVNEFSMSNLLAIHARRVTIQPRDMQLVRKLRGQMGLERMDP